MGSQLKCRNEIVKAYELATKNKPFKYLLIDFSNRTDPHAWRFSLRSNIFPDEETHTIVYGQPTEKNVEASLTH